MGLNAFSCWLLFLLKENRPMCCSFCLDIFTWSNSKSSELVIWNDWPVFFSGLLDQWKAKIRTTWAPYVFSPMDLFLFLFLNAEEQSCLWTLLTACFTGKVDRYQTVLKPRLQMRLLDRWMCVLLMEICISIVKQYQSTIYFQVKRFKTNDRKVFL